MKELLDAVDAALVEASDEHADEGVILIPCGLWDKICIERSKLEPDAPEMQRGPDMLADVRAFLTIGHPHMLPIEPGIPEFGVEALCRRLISEELLELDKGRAEQDLVQIADAVQDLIWVVICLGFAYGLPMSLLWREVARTNLAKFPGGVVLRRPEDGKILKPEGWEPPRIREIVAAAFLVTPLPQALDALLRPSAPNAFTRSAFVKRISNPLMDGIYPPWTEEQEITSPVWFDFEHHDGKTHVAVYPTEETQQKAPVADLVVGDNETPAEAVGRWWAEQRKKLVPAPVAPDPHCKECGVPILEKSHGDLCDPCETKKRTEEGPL